MNSRALVTLAVALAAAQSAGAQSCDRGCLSGILDRYLNAIVANDPSGAPLAVGFRQTENAVVIKRGTGAWESVTGLGAVGRRFFDPVSGQSAYFGLVEEGAGRAIVTVRVRVEEAEITEAEWYIARQGDPGITGPPVPGESGGNLFDAENLIANPPPNRRVPAGKPGSRETLAAVTNSYFDGITTHDGSIIRAHPGCVRVENGFKTTGRPMEPLPNGQVPLSDCTSNLENINIQFVAARRYPLVDTEANVVLATVVFLRRPGTPQRRNGLSELFFIDDNRISSIWAAMFYPPPAAPMPNWPPYDGNFPLPASLGAEN
jgi:hypothetical protein